MDKLNTVLQHRYERLYGPLNHKKRIEKVEKELKIRLGVVCAIFLLLLFFSILTEPDFSQNIALDKKGKIAFLQRPQEGEKARSFQVEVSTKSSKGTFDKDFSLTIEPEGEIEEGEAIVDVPKTYEDEVNEHLQQVISSINADRSSKKIYLPQKLKSGEILEWSTVNQTSNTPLYFIAMIGVIFVIYKSRFHSVEREEREAKESIIRELPEFINKLVLLLNAGVVLNTAFQKIMEDRSSLNPPENYFYNQMGNIFIKVKEANGSIHQELRVFSKRSGVRELMRFANIINDNISKGADLVNKLEQESELLWFSRKQQSEEKGRLAESKMTMPLMILLLVLIMVTIAPAMMEM